MACPAMCRWGDNRSCFRNARGVQVRRGQVALPRRTQAGNVARAGGSPRIRVGRREAAFAGLVACRSGEGQISLSLSSPRRLPAGSAACAGGGPAVPRWQARCSFSGPCGVPRRQSTWRRTNWRHDFFSRCVSRRANWVSAATGLVLDVDEARRSQMTQRAEENYPEESSEGNADVATEESSGGNADFVTVFRHEGFPPERRLGRGEGKTAWILQIVRAARRGSAANGREVREREREAVAEGEGLARGRRRPPPEVDLSCSPFLALLSSFAPSRTPE